MEPARALQGTATTRHRDMQPQGQTPPALAPGMKEAERAQRRADTGTLRPGTLSMVTCAFISGLPTPQN